LNQLKGETSRRQFLQPKSISNGEPAKRIHVSCGIIHRDRRVLAVQRSEQMSLPLKWEFPGGKIEPGETPEACVERELMEELELSVTVGEFLKPVTHAYDGFTVTLYPFICGIRSGEILLHEHAAFAWLAPFDLPRLDWADADRPVLLAYLKTIGFKGGEPS
jgi:8-oxo-dGTP diphosphatase